MLPLLFVTTTRFHTLLHTPSPKLHCVHARRCMYLLDIHWISHIKCEINCPEMLGTLAHQHTLHTYQHHFHPVRECHKLKWNYAFSDNYSKFDWEIYEYETPKLRDPATMDVAAVNDFWMHSEYDGSTKSHSIQV